MSFNDIALFIRNLFGGSKTFLHEPSFNGKEKEYVIDTIDSTFKLSAGDYVRNLKAIHHTDRIESLLQ